MSRLQNVGGYKLSAYNEQLEVILVTFAPQCSFKYCHTVLPTIPKEKPHIYSVVPVLMDQRSVNGGESKWISSNFQERQKMFEFFRIEVYT